MGSKGSQTTTTAANPLAMSAYSGVLSGAQNLVANTPASSLVAPINQQQYSGIASINTATPQFQQAAAPITANQINRYLNPYTQDVVQATEAQFANTNAQQQEQIEGNAAAQGALGGNRIGVEQGIVAGQQQTAEAPVIAGLETAGYTAALGTALQEQQAKFQGAAGTLGAGSQQVGAGTLEQQTSQAAAVSPLQEEQYLASLVSGVGSLTGGTSTAPPPTTASQVAGYGTGAIGLGMLLSDRRAKEKIHKIGELNDGQPIYRYRYKGSPEWHIGLMAQDVEKKHPEAVESAPNEYKMIDVKAATEDSVEKKANGGVAGFADGGNPLAGVLPGGVVPTYPLTQGPGPPSIPQQTNTSSAQQMFMNALQMANKGSGGGGSGGGNSGGMPAFGQGVLGKPIMSLYNSMTNPAPVDVTPTSSGVAPPTDAFGQKYGGAVTLPEHNRIDLGRKRGGATPMRGGFGMSSFVPSRRVAGFAGGGASLSDAVSGEMSDAVLNGSSNPGAFQSSPIQASLPNIQYWGGPNNHNVNVSWPIGGEAEAFVRGQGPSGNLGGYAGLQTRFSKGGVAGFADGGSPDFNSTFDQTAANTPAPLWTNPQYLTAYTAPPFPPAGNGQPLPAQPASMPVSQGDGAAPVVPAPTGGLDVATAAPQAASAAPAVATAPANVPAASGVAAPPTATSAPSKGLLGGFGDRDTGMALLSAGLGMLGSRSPFTGVAVGEGGQMGLQTYLGLKRQEQEQGIKQQDVDIKVKQLAQSAKAEQDRLAMEGRPYSEMTVAQQAEQRLKEANLRLAQEQPVVMGQDVLGRNIYGTKGADGQLRPIELPTGVSASGNPAGEGKIGPLPGVAENIAQKMATYDLPPPTGGFAMGKPAVQAMISRAIELNPDFDATTYSSKKKAVDAFGVGKQGDQTKFWNNAVQHFDTLDKLIGALGNGDVQALNTFRNAFKTQFGYEAPADFNAAKAVVGQEIVKAIVANGGGEREREEAGKALSSAASPEQLRGVLNTYRELGGAQLRDLEKQYEASTGLHNYGKKYLIPEAQAELEKVKARANAPAASSGAGAAASGFTGRTASGPNGAKLRETTGGQWVP